MLLSLQRVMALIVDLLVLAVVLVAVSRFLPDGPPPVGAMAFFTAEDFRNYFILVSISLLLSAVRVLPLPGSHRTASPGDALFGLRLVRSDLAEPTWTDRLNRWRWGLLPLSLVLVPGPLISLMLGVLVADYTDGAFTTPDDLMNRAGFPGWLSYTLHGLSFAALAAAVIHLVFAPVARVLGRAGRGPHLSALDQLSGTTHVSTRVRASGPVDG